ncbi:MULTISPECIES: hypothetical protein [unclassified Chryseobacterium]|uniref:hypothetical protein n=1 Tax=unclassified Chryseobacterium TaxID=2593645 RepID=UPI00100A5919|nr:MULTISPECIES: hypothetical protein [unclassified Chryseobacterium]
MKALYFFMICTLFYYCKKNNKSETFQASKKEDTISAPAGYHPKEESCKKVMKGFTRKYSVLLSNFYSPEKSLVFNTKDSVMIAKPFYTQVDIYGDCFPEEAYGSLLLVYNNSSHKTNGYKNALYDDEPNTFQEILSESKGFVISAERGNSSKIYAKVKVVYRGSDLYVDNIQLESWGMKQYKKKYAFKNLKLENYSVKMIDSLQIVSDK